MQLTAFLLAALTATVSVVHAAPAATGTGTGTGTYNNEERCWNVCFKFEPTCQTGLYPKDKSVPGKPCWTCCRESSLHHSGMEFALQGAWH